MTVINNLELILADSYAIYFKTQNYHWNVTCKEFKSLHLLFEDQYKDLAEAIDEIAERIRILGSKVSQISKLIQLTTINEAQPTINSSMMIKDLADDQDRILLTLENGLKIAQKSEDEAITDIIIQRIKVHQKNKWMLLSSIEN